METDHDGQFSVCRGIFRDECVCRNCLAVREGFVGGVVDIKGRVFRVGKTRVSHFRKLKTDSWLTIKSK